MILFQLLQSTLGICMTSCCIFGISGMSGTIATPTLDLYVLPRGQISSLLPTWKETLHLQMLHCIQSLLRNLDIVTLQIRQCCASSYSHHIEKRELCIYCGVLQLNKMFNWSCINALNSQESMGKITTPTSFLCRPTLTLVFTKTTGVACWGFWRPLLDQRHTHSSFPGCHWFIWAQPVHSVTP